MNRINDAVNAVLSMDRRSIAEIAATGLDDMEFEQAEAIAVHYRIPIAALCAFVRDVCVRIIADETSK